MPHVSEFHVTPDHDRHDQLLVAALAAGDLSGIDRDHALTLTRSCASCASLHDDLLAIARATASVPPPHVTRPRDFQLTPADAARLRPAGWRRIVAGLAGANALATRPLGVGLATLGLVGLLIGNAPVLSLGGSGGAPAAAPDGATSLNAEGAGGQPAASPAGPEAVRAPAAGAAASAPAASDNAYAAAGPELSGSAAANPVPAASRAARTTQGDGIATDQAATPAVPVATIAGGPAVGEIADQAGDQGPLRPSNVLFGLAVLAGLGLLVAGRIRSRSPV